METQISFCTVKMGNPPFQVFHHTIPLLVNEAQGPLSWRK